VPTFRRMHVDRTDASNDGRPRGAFRTAFHWKPNARDLCRHRLQQNGGRAIPFSLIPWFCSVRVSMGTRFRQ